VLTGRRFRVEFTAEQAEYAEGIASVCRAVWNIGLEQRREYRRRGVGVIEIVAGVAVAIKPRYAAYIVAAWLAGIIINLLSYPGFYDVALRDFGLLLGRPDPGSTGFCVRPGLASTDPGAQLISLPL